MADSALTVSRLDQAIRAAGVAIDGVSPDGQGGYRVYPSSLQAAAQPIIDTFNPDDPALIAVEKDAQAASIDSNLLIQAVAQLDFEERQKLTVKAGQTLRTAAECKARVKAIYRGLLG